MGSFGGGSRGQESGSFGGGMGGGMGGRPMGRPPMGGPRPPMGGRPMGGPMFGRPMFGGFRRGYYGMGPRPVMGGPFMGGPAGGGCCLGCGGGLIGIVMLALLLIAIVLALFMDAFTGCAAVTVQSSTRNRAALPASAATQTALYQNDSGLRGDSSALERGLRDFYEDTGVYPYVYLAPEGSLTSESACQREANEIYPQLTSDEAHLVMVVCPQYDGSYLYALTVGTQARSVVDSEAQAILEDYLATYVANNSDVLAVIGQAFAATGERIMEVTQPWYVGALPIVAVIVAGAVIAIVVYNRRMRAKEQAEHVQEVLNTPLEKFSDQELEDLADKYEGK